MAKTTSSKTAKAKVRSMPNVKPKIGGIPKGGKIKAAKETDAVKNAVPKVKTKSEA